MKEAKFYSKLNEDKILCETCPRGCIIPENKYGFCKAYHNESGKLYNVRYGEIVSIGLDPIEKKPLFHFYPGSKILSVGTNGCNLRCQFCQNWELVEGNNPTNNVNPEVLLELAEEYDSIGIAFTYNEPTISYEFVYDTFKLFKEHDLKTVFVTNGYINEKPLLNLLPLVDALNIDLKSIKSEFYKKICKGNIEPVKRSIELSCKYSFVEVTNLIIPSLNDTKEEFFELRDFIANISPDIPLHLSRYFPNYKLTIPETPIETLLVAFDIMREKLNYVYIGNAIIEGKENSYCPNCGNLLVSRIGYSVNVSGITKDTRCNKCNIKLPFII
jgi:pyruvate formate lyase activating enzyme